jgi:predicted metal-dependent phosphotriesterase family hydrolase
LPALRDAGVDEDTLNLLVRENPRNLLAHATGRGA